MDAYSSFASVYDQFMDNVPYEEWAEYLTGLLGEYQVHDGLVLDLGCGTGSLTEILAKKGYDMIGIDNSEDMLQIAMDKRAASDCHGKAGRFRIGHPLSASGYAGI